MGEKETRPWTAWLLSGLQTAALWALVLVFAMGAMGLRARAADDGETGRKMLIPVGQTVGIKLFSRGVMVVGFSEIATENGEISPAKACGLKAGDIITHIDGQQVDSIEEVEAVVQSAGEETLSLQLSRGGRTVEMEAAAMQCAADGSYKLGAWIRDSMAGIGTVTYYDPETGTFAALGHGINDVDTNLLMPLQSGGIMASTVTDVLAGAQGAPGQLHGSFDLSHDLGTLFANTSAGVFGVAEKDIFSGAPVPVAHRDEVKVGPAVIRANVSGDEVQEFSVEILRVYRGSETDSRSMMLHVTDEALLAATGGIVQGMSGSPILQDGKLVGAVTHVLVNDPTCGYGIFAENMLAAEG